MKTITNEGFIIQYYTKNELDKLSKDEKMTYEMTYEIAEKISITLGIECPYIGLYEGQIMRSNGSILNGVTFFKEDLVTPQDKPVILATLFNFEITLFTGCLAHELRHVWQHNLNLYTDVNKALNFVESAKNPAEIDADIFAIFFTSWYFNMNVKKASEILCPFERIEYPIEYSIRKKYAKEMLKSGNQFKYYS